MPCLLLHCCLSFYQLVDLCSPTLNWTMAHHHLDTEPCGGVLARRARWSRATHGWVRLDACGENLLAISGFLTAHQNTSHLVQYSGMPAHPAVAFEVLQSQVQTKSVVSGTAAAGGTSRRTASTAATNRAANTRTVFNLCDSFTCNNIDFTCTWLWCSMLVLPW